MTFRTAVAVVVFLAVVATQHARAGAQGGPPAGAPGQGGAGAPGRGRGAFDAGPFTPTPGAKDLKSVLFNWTWRMGMLRSGAEAELIKTLDYHAEGGTIQVDGQPCTLTKYRVQANYQVPGYRAQIECTRANGQKFSNVETVSGDFAWNEDIPGAELVAGKGKATPKQAALEERLIRLWASPHGRQRPPSPARPACHCPSLSARTRRS